MMHDDDLRKSLIWFLYYSLKLVLGVQHSFSLFLPYYYVFFKVVLFSTLLPTSTNKIQPNCVSSNTPLCIVYWMEETEEKREVCDGEWLEETDKCVVSTWVSEGLWAKIEKLMENDVYSIYPLTPL